MKLLKDDIRVFAPATVANVGCGFDVLGFCLGNVGDEVILRRTEGKEIRVTKIQGAEYLPFESDKNVASVAIRAMLDELGVSLGLEVELYKNVKPGSGMGSSASSSAGAVYALNEMLDKPFLNLDLVRFAMKGEEAASQKAHADNVAPAIMGGFTLVRSYNPLDIVSLDFPKDLHAVVVYPQVDVKTSDASKMLRKEIKLQQAITQWANVAGLVSGLSKSDYDLISRSMEDVIVEPIRSILIPYFGEAKEAALSKGALSFNISGSGPSVFSFTDSEETALDVEKAINEVFEQHQVETRSFVSTISPEGARVLE
ncbi:MAG: homoserine kinase [Bacteroidota bacterium]